MKCFKVFLLPKLDIKLSVFRNVNKTDYILFSSWWLTWAFKKNNVNVIKVKIYSCYISWNWRTVKELLWMKGQSSLLWCHLRENRSICNSDERNNGTERHMTCKWCLAVYTSRGKRNKILYLQSILWVYTHQPLY